MSKTIKIQGIDFDIDLLEDIHCRPTESFEDFGKRINIEENRNLFFRNNGGNVLMIAHLDSTMPASHFGTDYGRGDREGHHLIWSPTVDDRLGAFVLVELLPKLIKQAGLPPIDILLTDDEECGRSTASFFDRTLADNRQYNWMGQFDRMKMDVVHYQYTSPDWLGVLRGKFPHVEWGMLSDICKLERLGCSGANFGCAYYDYTSFRAWADLDELAMMVTLWMEFYREQHEKYFKHEERRWEDLDDDIIFEGDFYDEEKFSQIHLTSASAINTSASYLSNIITSSRNRRRANHRKEEIENVSKKERKG